MEFVIDALKGTGSILESLWPAVVVVVITAAKWLNNRTQHWTKWPLWNRLFGLIVEVLDLWRPPELKGKEEPQPEEKK